ncbi:zincin-like metallopeptidase domain-containing protein [Solidesulfovibrio sp.]|uniref:zincin-like metallopeptidase domain-containing protein n=1 Tax=Solidesulfovibrio sp. TaxID=2910990 RepID=UPI0026310D95|nr:zincin-like metallopeptidase domain-containing protein [Solidesulfovibrio sp.]
MADDKKTRKPFHEEFAEKIIEDLKRGVAPWQKPWRPGEVLPPLNPVSGTVYSGINRVMLSRYGFADPRWMTLRQANTQDCRVRKGEKAETIVYWQFSKEEPTRDDDGKPILDDEGNQVMQKVELTRPLVRFSSVFHVSQLAGEIPPLDKSSLVPPWDPNEKAETILQNSGAVIKHNQRNRAFYSLSTDEICLPPKDHFLAQDAYYATALHELGHWTGHVSRLAREFGPFGSEVYAREELRAEIASWMLGQDLGIGHDPGQHLAYVGSWIKALEKDPFEIVRACRDAERIKHYVITMEQKQEQHQELVGGREEEIAAARVPLAAPDSKQETVKEPTDQKVFLAVPYRERGRAKSVGARWDPEAKLWYAPEGADMAKLKAWLPEKTPEAAPAMPPQAEFALALKAAGLDLGGQEPVMDGKIHRTPLLDGAEGKLDGAYVGYLDGIPAGFIQNHRTGEKTNWKATGHVLSDEQKAALRAEAEKRRAQQELERRAQQEKASKRAYAKFINAKEASPEQAYLAKKGVPGIGVREDENGNLLVPGYDTAGFIHTLQTISQDGKQFEAGSRKKGTFFPIDPEGSLGQDVILIAEGYATAASVHLATGKPVVAAFDAGNLEPVAVALREKFPNAPIVILADNDHGLSVNVGVEKASLAAKTAKGVMIVPSFFEAEKTRGMTDFNDLHAARGLEHVRCQLERSIERCFRVMREEGHFRSLNGERAEKYLPA